MFLKKCGSMAYRSELLHIACIHGQSCQQPPSLLSHQTQTAGGHGGKPKGEHFRTGFGMHTRAPCEPCSRQWSHGDRSSCSPSHVFHTQLQPAYLRGDERSVVVGMKTTRQATSRCSISIDSRPLSKQI